MASTANTGPSWDDVWQALEELEARTGRPVQVQIWRPRGEAGKGFSAPRASVTVDVTREGKTKPRTRFGYLGGARGARTMPAAVLRAVLEVCWSLDEDQDTAAEQARLL